MKETICQTATSLWDAVKAPEMRHRLHYEWGLYKNKNEKSPLVSFRLHNECCSPLIKILAVIAMVAAACAGIAALASLMERLCHRKSCRCRVAHFD